jgi:hypothetical protein
MIPPRQKVPGDGLRVGVAEKASRHEGLRFKRNASRSGPGLNRLLGSFACGPRLIESFCVAHRFPALAAQAFRNATAFSAPVGSSSCLK